MSHSEGTARIKIPSPQDRDRGEEPIRHRPALPGWVYSLLSPGGHRGPTQIVPVSNSRLRRFVIRTGRSAPKDQPLDQPGT